MELLGKTDRKGREEAVTRKRGVQVRKCAGDCGCSDLQVHLIRLTTKPKHWRGAIETTGEARRVNNLGGRAKLASKLGSMPVQKEAKECMAE